MKELIKIGASRIGDETVMTVSAREIATFLGLGKDFTNRIKVQVKRAKLVQGVDYILIKIYPQEGEKIKRGRPADDYLLTVDAGKQVCMISGTDKGFEVRAYFIECEKIALSTAVQQIDPPQTVTRRHRDQLAAHLIADSQDRLLTPTEIGRIYNIGSPQEVNRRLEAIG